MIVLDRNGVQIEKGDRVKRHYNPGSGIVTGFLGKRVVVQWPSAGQGRRRGTSTVNPKLIIVIQKAEKHEATCGPQRKAH